MDESASARIGVERGEGGGGPSGHRRGGKLAVWVAVAAASLALLAGAAVGVAHVLGREAPAFPEELLDQGVPSGVRELGSVSIGSGGTESASAEEQAWRLADFFGLRQHPTVALLRAKGEEPAALEQEGVLRLLSDEKPRADAKREAGLIESIADERVYMMRFEDGGTMRNVIILHTQEGAEAGVELRGETTHHAFSGIEGECEVADAEQTECLEEGSALMRRGRWTAVGSHPDVLALSRAWSRGVEDRDEESTNVELARIGAAALPVGSTDALEIKPEEVNLTEICKSVLPGLLAIGCMPEDISESLRRVAAETRAYGARSMRHEDREERLAIDYVFVGRDDEAAGEIARELEPLVRDFRAHLRDQEASLLEKVREGERPSAPVDEVRLRALIRAFEDPDVGTDGRVAFLRLRADYTETDLREMQEARATQREDLEVAGRVTDAMAAGAQPERADLARFVGDDAATWMLTRRATQEDCDKIQEHIESLIAAGVPTEEFGDRYLTAALYEPSICVGIGLPEANLRCLVGAASFPAMVACPIARPAWEEHGAQ